MGKVFNDQIVKILCAKNLSAQASEAGEPADLSRQSSRLRRGESYVVFINKHNRKELQRAISSLERNYMATLPHTAAHPRSTEELRVPHPLNIRESWSSSLDSFRHLLQHSFNAKKCRESKESTALLPSCCLRHGGSGSKVAKTLITPALFGPFVDESLCASFDRVYYCFCLMFGRELEPVALPLDSSADSLSESSATSRN